MWTWSCNYIVLGGCLALGKMTLFDRLSRGTTWAEKDVGFLHRNTLGKIHTISFLETRVGQVFTIMFSSNTIF